MNNTMKSAYLEQLDLLKVIIIIIIIIIIFYQK